MLIREAMSPHAARLRADAHLQRAAELIAMSGAGDLRVVDGDTRFVGVLSEGDVLRAAKPDRDEIAAQGRDGGRRLRPVSAQGRDLRDRPIGPYVIS